MIRSYRKSIRSRLRAVMMLTSTTAIVLTCIGVFSSDVISGQRELNHELSMLAEVIGSNSVAPLSFRDAQTAREVLGALQTQPSVIGGCLYTSDGAPFATYSSKAGLVIPRSPGADGFQRKGDHVELVRAITIDGERIGTLYIVSDRRDVIDRLANHAVILGGIFLAALVAAWVLSWQLARVISEPIVELASVAKRVSTVKDYALRATSASSSEDEVGSLIEGFNGMLAEIQRRDADLEHQVELRTRELRTANREHELILNSIGEGVIGCDLEGKMIFANPASLRMLGWNAGELTGRSGHEILHHSKPDGSPYPKEKCPTAATLKDGVARQVHDEVLWRRDGSSFPVDYLAAPMADAEGRITGLTFTFRDITERRAIEKMKDEFVSTVSHELRTPLTSIRGALGLLASGMLGNVAEKGLRMLNIAVSNTDRLVRLINDILDLERIDSGRVELSRTDAVAGQLMVSAVEGVQTMAQQAGVELVVHTETTILWADSDRIVQTLTNLLSNAIKFSPPGTAVTLSGSATPDGGFTFRVADQGRGVPEDKLETIFERFKQVDASDSREKGGSGLGLAICRSIVSAHEGKIWAESNGDKGSVFQFTISPRPAALSTSTIDAVPRVILLCAEDGSELIQMRGVLQARGFNVHSVTAATEVIGRALAISPNAIVLDVGSHDGRGWEMLEQLRANHVTQKIPVVVVAADPAAERRAREEGISNRVTRPLEGDSLARSIAAACEGPAVLIVEDDLDLARVMVTSLQAKGIRTLHAATGAEALALCRSQRPALIVLDLTLQDMDGFAVVSSLRSSRALASVPLLVYSAREVGAADQARLRLGPTEFLTKSRCSLDEVEGHLVRLLTTVTAPFERRDAA